MVAIVGRPNAGKSTLLNALTGARVGIISPKPNTTRVVVRGITHSGHAQLVWLDTPGLNKSAKAFERRLVQQANGAMADADVVLVLLDASHAVKNAGPKALQQEAEWVSAALGRKQSVIVGISKVDLVKAKVALLPVLETINAWGVHAVVPLSASKKIALDDLVREVAKLAPAGPWLFPADMVTDAPLHQRLAEFTREQAMNLLQQEVPYGVGVMTEAVVPAQGEAPMLVQQIIMVVKESHKPMVVGAGGSMLKQIGMRARKVMQEALGEGVRLELRVKVEPFWQSKADILNDLGV